jgi:hypothetical protein
MVALEFLEFQLFQTVMAFLGVKWRYASRQPYHLWLSQSAAKGEA